MNVHLDFNLMPIVHFRGPCTSHLHSNGLREAIMPRTPVFENGNMSHGLSD